MIGPVEYLLKVSLGLAIVALPYYLLLRNDPNLVLKRIYLLAGIALSWIIPLMGFRVTGMMEQMSPAVLIDLGQAPTALPAAASSAGRQAPDFPWIALAIAVYVAGFLFLFLKNFLFLVRWNRHWQRSKDDHGIAYTPSEQVFTLLNRIYVPRQLKGTRDLENILLHEKAHLQQLHFIDLILAEFTLVLTWFNPFSWLISRMIKENHEHLADRQVLSTGVNPAWYRAQLLNHAMGMNIYRLGNHFNHSLTSKRFNMMKKPEKSLQGILKLALLVPAVILAMGMATAKDQEGPKTITGKVVLGSEAEPAIGAAVVVANTSMGTVVDKDGTFSLNVTGDPEIVISFVGYETLRLKASGIGKKPLVMNERAYTVDLGKGGGGRVEIRASEAEFIPENDEGESVIVLNGEVVVSYDHLDPEDIERVEVIKDPDSEVARKYGARNGVILITTKEDTPKLIDPGDEVFFVVEEMPMYPAGRDALRDYIYSRLKYPEGLKEQGVAGEVTVQFVVNARGELKDLHVVSSTRKEFEKPVLEVFSDMPVWNPGRQRGKPVQVRVLMPIRFDPNASS